MIAFAIAVALQSNPNPVQIAVERYDQCIEAASRKFMSSPEPADVVASAAMWECSARELDLFEAQLIELTRGRPANELPGLRLVQAGKQAERQARRKERAIYWIVTQRLGMPSHMPSTDYNSALPR